MELIRSRYLDLEIKNREAEADYLAPKHGNPTPYRQAVGASGVATMTSTIEYDLEAMRESIYDEPAEMPPRYAVIGCLLIAGSTEHDDLILETDSLWEARVVADLETHCQGVNGWDAAIVWDQHTGRIVPDHVRSIRRAS
jgi:hypothetical protein